MNPGARAAIVWRLAASAALLLGGLYASSIPAHALRLALQADGGTLRGQARYADGTPAAGERVELFAGAETAPAARAQVDRDGRFAFQVAPGRAYRVVVHGEEGHRVGASIEMPRLAATAAAPGAMSGAPPSAPPDAAPARAAPLDESALRAAVSAELAPLRASLVAAREDIARLEQKLRWQDLIGGLGYLAGLAGLAAWWFARRRP